MAHHDDGIRKKAWAQNYKLVQPPVPEQWRLPLDGYEIPLDAVMMHITPALRIDDDGAMHDAPVVEFVDRNGDSLGTINDGSPWP